MQLSSLPRHNITSHNLEALREHLESRLRSVSCTPAEVPALLDAALCCLLLPPGPIAPGTNPTALVADAAAAAAADSATCGYIFKTGDIAWVCRTCQSDDTCVLCQECYAASNHEGHEVFFHRTRAGGCCE